MVIVFRLMWIIQDPMKSFFQSSAQGQKCDYKHSENGMVRSFGRHLSIQLLNYASLGMESPLSAVSEVPQILVGMEEE